MTALRGCAVKAFQAAGEPVISVDTKKQELLGDFKNGGRELRPEGQPKPVRVPKSTAMWLPAADYAENSGPALRGDWTSPSNIRNAACGDFGKARKRR